jgi:DHA2 family multidrug resistance protein
MLDTFKNGMIASGADPAAATQKAYAMVFGVVQRHAAMLAYIDTFLLLAIMFIAVIPLILIMKKPSLGGGGTEGMGH